MNGQYFQTVFEKTYPKNLAYNWDNVGLQIGTLHKEITNVLLSLDLTLEVLQEANSKNCNLIVVHHPMIFSPIKKIVTDSYQGKLIEFALKHDIAVYVAHTNFDISNEGMNKILADLLDLKDQEIIDYTTEVEGLGRIGTIETISLTECIANVKKAFNLVDAKLIGQLDKKITTIAISGGSGSSLLKHPRLAEVDLFITGDISYHHALDALNDGLTVLDVGHNVEKFGLKSLQKILKQNLHDTNIIISEIDTNPYKTV